MARSIIKIVPFEGQHYAMLPVRAEQRGELARMGVAAGHAADLGPAFSAVETDEDGEIIAVLACAGLAETVPPDAPSGGYATAWAAFAEGMRAAQWSSVTAAIRGVIEGAEYARIDMLVSGDWPAAQRYAEALGFTMDMMVYARRGGAAPPRES
jgi:hypothetical protein